MSKKTILVTGAAGFIGSNLADRLIKEGYAVIGIDDLSAGVPEQVPKGVEFRKADIRSKDIFPIVKKADVVFHLAAKNSVVMCQRDPYDTADVNVMGTLNVFEACRAAGIKRVIYAETSAIYEGTKTLPTPETDFTPQTFYAISKASDHLFAKAYGSEFGMEMVGLRYLNVYGPRQDYRRAIPPVMTRFIIRLLMGERPPVYGDGSERRDYIHVDDVNDFHVLCIGSDKVAGRVFNLGCGKNYAILEVLAMIQKILGTNIKPEFVPNLPGAAPANLADITAARSVGWEPRVGLEEGLRGVVDYVKAEITKGNITHSI
ncbi:MAG: NAD-dependent epimerase/dehydratase family protein [Minisyncoccia bacterium]|jgi:UDP-glucose 4-epimerase